MSIVRFNRKFTQAQLTTAEGTSSINGTAVINGAWYIASSNATALYVGSMEGGSTAILKRVANISDFSSLDSTISKTASGATDSATTRTDSVQVVSGFTLVETDGLLDTSSAVSSSKADMAGAADKAYDDAKNYADSLISGLGVVMFFGGVASTEADLKTNVTTPKKGEVWIVSADASEWVYTGDSVDATHPYDTTKWEKFGTTDVQGALYKGSNAFTNGSFVIADGTDGKMKVISDADIATRLNYKTKQTAVTDSGSGYVSSVTQDTNGVITVRKSPLPMGSGSVGTASAADDAWKTVVHDVSLSDHTLSGNTKSIPAATTSSDGYMTSSSVINLNTAILALTWDE